MRKTQGEAPVGTVIADRPPPKSANLNEATACYTSSVHVGAAGTSPSWHNPYKD